MRLHSLDAEVQSLGDFGRADILCQQPEDLDAAPARLVIETAKPLLQALVQSITGVKVVSLHHDISTVTGEAFVILTLAEPPAYRPAKKI